MDLDFSKLSAYQRYKLMASLIIPRPIALVTTLGDRGVVNAAPIGEILWMHARNDLIDVEKYRLHLHNYFPIARFGASYYARTRDRFAIEKDEAHSTEAPGHDPNPIDVL